MYLCMTNKEVEASGTRMISKLVMQATRLLIEFIEWIKTSYGTIGEVETTCGGVHNTLEMKLD